MTNDCCASLWMGDIEAWMDEPYIISLFKDIGILFCDVDIDVIGVKIMKDKLSGLRLGK